METIFDLKDIEAKIIENLKKVFDPEIPTNIFDLGLIYGIDFEQKNQYLHCTITMTLTSPTCPVAESLLEQVKYVTLAVDEVDEAKVTLVFSPPWDPSMMSEDAKEVMGASGAAMPF
jgi:metal-sulfur cluster biosynthetic enzyme|uniref:metal-sulfur cluster assembly factor n=1 Tax=Aliarcobacter sp. TaxID=2321116 RepID=UPI004047820C